MAFPWRPVALTPFAAACQSGGSRLSGAGGLVSSPMSIRGRPEGDPREIRGKSQSSTFDHVAVGPWRVSLRGRLTIITTLL